MLILIGDYFDVACSLKIKCHNINCDKRNVVNVLKTSPVHL